MVAAPVPTAGDASRPWQDSPVRVTLTNPLPAALAHYEAELRDCLGHLQPTALGSPRSEGVEGFSGLRRIGRGLGLVGRRLKPPGSDVHLVLWPALGYYDPLTWSLAARRQPVVLVMHDIEPLRPGFGYSPAAHRAFAAATRAGRIRVVCHTQQAADLLGRLTGVVATVVPHPMLTPRPASRATGGGRPVLRVLGQYKEARDLEVLEAMAREAGVPGRDAPGSARGQPAGVELEIWGRGWPEVPGWHVHPEFIDEAAFTRLATTASAVVLPYLHYWQSGVMVRAAESCVPVVGVAHPQVRFLYGDRWPGTVGEDGSWLAAAHRAIAAGGVVADRVRSAHEEVRAGWTDFLARATDR
jgi:hypothetical protein